MLMDSSKKIFWQFPWLYGESFVISFALIIIGLAIEILNLGKGVPSPCFPYNIFIIILLIVLIPLLYFLFHKNTIIKWLSSVPAATASIISVVILALIMGIIPQNDKGDISYLKLIGFNHIFQSWAFAFSCLNLIIVLGFTIVKRISCFKLQSIGFLFNHLGLWIIMVSALLGSGDVKKLNFYCYLNEPTNIAYNSAFKTYSMPFAIQLEKFEIEEYPPYLVLFDNNSGKILDDKNKMKCEVIKDQKYKIKNYDIYIKNYINESIIKDDSCIKSKDIGSFQSAYLIVKDINSKNITKGWVSCGSYKYPPGFLKVDKKYSVAIAEPETKKYRSFLKILEEENADTKYDNITIEVNKPFNYKGWKLYQYSYNADLGKWSDYSVIQAVYDPWLNFVYLGIYMLIIGAVFMFWHGKKM